MRISKKPRIQKPAAETMSPRRGEERDFSEEGVIANITCRTITISGQIVHPMFSKVDFYLTELEAASSRKGITIRICSPGGDVNEALALVGRIRTSPCTITTIGYGQIMSAATLVFASGNEKVMSKYCSFMHHMSSIYIDGHIKHVELKQMAKQSSKEESLWSEWMSELTNQDTEYWKTLGADGKDVYLTPKELLELKIIDRILED